MTTGERIAALRRERGWSQSDLAAALASVSGRGTVAREEVSRWEHGRRTPTPYWLGILAAVLGVLPDALRPAPGRQEPPADAVGILAEALDWLVSEPPQVTARRSGRRVGWDLAAQVAARAARLRHMDDTLPGRELAPVAAAEFAATAALVQDASYSEAVGRSLLTSLGETGQILGWIEADMGRHEAARHHYAEGFKAARQAGDTAGAANILSCTAYMWTAVGSAREGRLLAAAAVHKAAGRVPPLAATLPSPRRGRPVRVGQLARLAVAAVGHAVLRRPPVLNGRQGAAGQVLLTSRRRLGPPPRPAAEGPRERWASLRESRTVGIA